MQKITPFLWFDTQAEEAAKFYVSIFSNSKINKVEKLPDGKTLSCQFELDGIEYYALNGGPQFKLNEAFSLFIKCEDQAEIDKYWALLSEGATESQCGWIQDKFGLWWQVIPNVLGELLYNPDKEKAQKVMQAMLKMKKIVIADLEAAAV